MKSPHIGKSTSRVVASCTCMHSIFMTPNQAAPDKAVKEAIAAGVIKDDDINAIKKLRASIEAVPLNEIELHPVD